MTEAEMLVFFLLYLKPHTLVFKITKSQSTAQLVTLYWLEITNMQISFLDIKFTTEISDILFMHINSDIKSYSRAY